MKIYSKIIKIINGKMFFCTIIVIVLTFLAYIFILDSKYVDSMGDIEGLEFEGTYVSKDNKTINYSKNIQITIKNNDLIRIKGHFTNNVPENKYIYMSIQNLEVYIYQNDKLVYSYGEKGTYPTVVKSEGEVYDGFKSGGISTEDNIEIVMKNVYHNNATFAYSDMLDSFCITDRGTLLIHNIVENGFSLLSGGLVLLYGVFLYLTLLIMKIKKSEVPKTINTCAVYMIITGMLLVLRYEYVSLFFPYPTYCMILYTILLFLQVPILSRYLSFFLEKKRSILIKCTELIGEIAICIVVIKQITGNMDSFEGRGSYVVFVGISMMVWIAVLSYDAIKIKEKKYKVIRWSCVIFVVYVIPEIINYFFKFAPRLYFLNIGMLIFMTAQFYMSIKYISDSMIRLKRTTEMEYELMNNNVELMLSQIQPHFLYNSISSMQMLCKKDSQRAQIALGYFANYLRTNMDMLKSIKPISFRKEMEHVKNYLFLEKIRFGDLLNIEYDLKEMEFTLPALTIQPLIENAVKHGVGEKDEGGTIKIATFKEKNNVFIIIEDDGVGFEMNEYRKKMKDRIINDRADIKYTGFRNVKKRLESQCGGDIDINTKKGLGTKIIIYIPQKE